MLKGMDGLARVWVAAFNRDSASLARDNILHFLACFMRITHRHQLRVYDCGEQKSGQNGPVTLVNGDILGNSQGVFH